jgi:hypothetical protein
MQDPNSYQVGGDHYKTTYEHWDFVLNTGIGYLEGCATKYIARWRKSDKPGDLRKAQHYTAKLLAEFRTAYPRLRMPQTSLRRELAAFITANRIPNDDVPALVALVTWETIADLQVAYDEIGHCLRLEAEDELADPKPVPLEDSNRHAERVYDED